MEQQGFQIEFPLEPIVRNTQDQHLGHLSFVLDLWRPKAKLYRASSLVSHPLMPAVIRPPHMHIPMHIPATLCAAHGLTAGFPYQKCDYKVCHLYLRMLPFLLLS